MFCPECGGEFRPGIARCPDCEVDLEATERAEVDVALVVAGRTADPARLALWKSVLAAAGMPFVVQGDEASGLFPLGAFGAGSPGPEGRGGWAWGTDMAARVLVPEDRRDEARDLLEGVVEAAEGELGDEAGDETGDDTGDAG